MTTAIIGTGGIGSAIARRLASGGEALRLASRDTESARALATEIGGASVAAAGNRDALLGADAVILALRFTVLKNVIDEIADSLIDKVVVVPSNPLTADASGHVSRVLPESQSSGVVVADWLPPGAAATVPLRVPFPLDVTFPGEPSDGEPQLAAIEAWIAANTRPFYRR